SILQEPADKFGNDPSVEMMWAVKAYEHAETYFNILISVDPTKLKLCKLDNELYSKFRGKFKDLKIDKIVENDIKSEEAKQQWREFCEEFNSQVADWNMATLLRLDSSLDVSEHNTIIVPRTQFLAIEIARNREGLNSDLRTKYSPKRIKDSNNEPTEK
ncbi:hypothetical protein HELRODRAFT_71674, partial [Helobdella robusta]|uniref:Polysaccharide biosynthesis domain-containing protein n=1 Tax=Helobdella robusta TaxID=6412 RepID=T1G0Q1_HELRO